MVEGLGEEGVEEALVVDLQEQCKTLRFLSGSCKEVLLDTSADHIKNLLANSRYTVSAMTSQKLHVRQLCWEI